MARRQLMEERDVLKIWEVPASMLDNQLMGRRGRGKIFEFGGGRAESINVTAHK
jgi:hypothetical protein